jgi:hypothetical protein
VKLKVFYRGTAALANAEDLVNNNKTLDGLE